MNSQDIIRKKQRGEHFSAGGLFQAVYSDTESPNPLKNIQPSVNQKQSKYQMQQGNKHGVSPLFLKQESVSPVGAFPGRPALVHLGSSVGP